MVLMQYLLWHYTEALSGILGVGRNYLTSAWHRFMVGRHLRTLVAPWHRVTMAGLAHDRTIATRATNLFMEPILRMVGAVIRLAVIIAGLVVQIAIVLMIGMAIVLWVTWPALAVGSVGWGIATLFG